MQFKGFFFFSRTKHLSQLMFLWNSVYSRKAKEIKQSINYLKWLALILQGPGYTLNFITVLQPELSAARGLVGEVAGKENAWIGFSSEKSHSGCGWRMLRAESQDKSRPSRSGHGPCHPGGPPSSTTSVGNHLTAGSRRGLTRAEGRVTVPPDLVATGQTWGRLSLNTGSHSACVTQSPWVLLSRDAEIQM